MGKSRLTKNQEMYQKEVKRIQRSMRRYAKQGYEFGSFESYFPKPKRITRKAIQELQSYKGVRIKNLSTSVQAEEDETVADYRTLARIQIDNLYSELDNFPSEIRAFLVQQFDSMMYTSGLNAIETYDLNIDTDDINAVRDEGKIYLSMAIQNRPSLVYYIQNSGYDSWQAIMEYCSNIINELDDLGVLGPGEKSDLEDLFEMQLGFYENNAQLRKSRKKEERRQRREEIKRLRKLGTEYKHGKEYYSSTKLAERTKRLQQANAENVAKMSDEEFKRWAKGYR